MAAVKEHPLSAALRVWAELRPEFTDAKAVASEEGPGASADELKKCAKWLQQSITKFGASAAVADEGDRIALQQVAEEVIKAFTAVVGTLLALKKNAGATLIRELRNAGEALTQQIEALGMAAGTPGMALAAGKALEKTKGIERTATNNRAAIRRAILQCLAQLRDGQRELREALKNSDLVGQGSGDEGADDEDDDDELGGFDDVLEPGERRVVEALEASTTALEEALKLASQSCMSAPAADGSVPVSVAALEVAAAQGAEAVHAMDSLAAHSIGGVDAEEFAKSLVKFGRATDGLTACGLTAIGDEGSETARSMACSVENVRKALATMEAED